MEPWQPVPSRPSAGRAVCGTAVARLRVWGRHVPRAGAGSVSRGRRCRRRRRSARRLRRPICRRARHRVLLDRRPDRSSACRIATRSSSAWKCSSTAPTTCRSRSSIRSVNATAPGGTVVISVPIEIGPPLARQAERARTRRPGRVVRVRHARALPAGRARADAVCGRGDGIPARRVRGRRAARDSPGTKGSTGAGCSARSSGASTSSDGCSRRCRSSALAEQPGLVRLPEAADGVIDRSWRLRPAAAARLSRGDHDNGRRMRNTRHPAPTIHGSTRP